MEEEPIFSLVVGGRCLGHSGLCLVLSPMKFKYHEKVMEVLWPELTSFHDNSFPTFVPSCLTIFSSAESLCDSQRLCYMYITNCSVVRLRHRHNCRKLFVKVLSPLKFTDRLASNFTRCILGRVSIKVMEMMPIQAFLPFFSSFFFQDNFQMLSPLKFVY